MTGIYPEPQDPTTPEATEATIAHLRGLLDQHARESASEGPASGGTGDESGVESAKQEWSGQEWPEPATPARTTRTRRRRDQARRDEEAGRGQGEDPAPPGSHQEWLDTAREIALRQLNVSARSAHQVREAMLKRDVPAEVAEEVIERFERVGLLDDAEYAAMLVRTRHAERGLARRGLLHELALKGIAPEIAETALDQVDEADESEAALEIIRKRVASMRDLDATRRRNRLYGTLARKGYNSAAARVAIDRVLTEEGLDLY